jgi:hypothetical protein
MPPALDETNAPTPVAIAEPTRITPAIASSTTIGSTAGALHGCGEPTAGPRPLPPGAGAATGSGYRF